MKNTKPYIKLSPRLLPQIMVVCCMLCFCCCFGAREPRDKDRDSFTNPIARTLASSSVITFIDGKYYFVQNEDGCLFLSCGDDPTTLGNDRILISRPQEDYNLMHLWHPQMVRMNGVWYVYFSGDDGNTDNHQLYVLENSADDPLEGTFSACRRIRTDEDDNWAIHGHVFNHMGTWYMIWSGWESRRVLVETQCLYIAAMANPWTLSSERVLISRPEYEWERQWVCPDGNKSAYPIFVNEAPFFFCNDATDKIYLYYSASATWTPYYSVGELSAPKDADLLDPTSWTKNPAPVFRQDPDAGVYSTGNQCIIPSPDSTEYYLVYQADDNPDGTRRQYISISMQKIGFSDQGVPELGTPIPFGQKHDKPSGVTRASGH